MEKDSILRVAKNIRRQLITTANPNVLLSWGSSNFVATVFNRLPALAFSVNARLFSGTVVIALASDDTYEVHLVEKKSSRLVASDVYFDQMADIIDVAIERGEDPEAYEAFCKAQLALLINL